jgi:hypothetical protein
MSINRENYIDKTLATPAVYNYTQSGENYTVIYQPMGYWDEHGEVVAHIIEMGDGEIETSKYYSRGWAYWNFMDVMGDDFALADEAMLLEGDYLDQTINWSTEALEVIKGDAIPHSNEYWQALVVRLAYNAITSADEFADMVRSGKFTAEQVQQMLDLAAGAVLNGSQFRLQGLETIAA